MCQCNSKLVAAGSVDPLNGLHRPQEGHQHSDVVPGPSGQRLRRQPAQPGGQHQTVMDDNESSQYMTQFWVVHEGLPLRTHGWLLHCVMDDLDSLLIGHTVPQAIAGKDEELVAR